MKLYCQYGKNYYWKYCRKALILLENQLKTCDNINEHFLLSDGVAAPFEERSFIFLMFIIERMVTFVNREIELMFVFKKMDY